MMPKGFAGAAVDRLLDQARRACCRATHGAFTRLTEALAGTA